MTDTGAFSNQEGDWLDDLHRTDPFIAAITPEKIESALSGFPLGLVNGWNMSRLALEIQNIAGLGRAHPGDSPERLSNVDARTQITSLALLAVKLRQGLEGLPAEAEKFVFWEAYHCSESLADLPEADFQFSTNICECHLSVPRVRHLEWNR